MKKRSAILYIFCIVATVCLGLASRKYGNYLPDIIARYAGDSLWALMVFFLCGYLFPNKTTLENAIIALSFSFLIEISQLYQADWIVELRRNFLIRLVLGQGFLWSDLVCYSIGIFAGAKLEQSFLLNYVSPKQE